MSSKKIGIVIALLIAGLAGYFYVQNQNSTSMGGGSITTGEAASSGVEIALYKEGALPDHIIGNPDAKVTIVEYASLTCPFCANFHVNTYKKFKTNYIDTGKVLFIYRDFYLDDIARAGTTLAQCAPRDQFFTIVDLLYNSQNEWLRSAQPFPEMLKVLKLVGYSDEAVEACFKNEKIVKGVIADRERGVNEFGVNSTPTLFINGVKQQGGALSYANLTAIVDELLEAK